MKCFFLLVLLCIDLLLKNMALTANEMKFQGSISSFSDQATALNFDLEMTSKIKMPKNQTNDKNKILKNPSKNKSKILKYPPVKKNNIVVVLCSGKSGSVTLLQSFKELGVETHHRHLLDNFIRKLVNERSIDSNIIFIDSIRDIIARKISSYFFNITKYTGMSQEQILEKYGREGLGFLIKRFNEIVMEPASFHGFDAWKKWKRLDYDCLTEGVFDFEKKYQIKRKGNFYFINLRFDEIRDWETIIKGIKIPIDLSKFKIMESNLSEEKWYYSLYKDFLNTFTMPQSTFDAIMHLNEKELSHFYTEEERQNFIDKWKPYIRN